MADTAEDMAAMPDMADMVATVARGRPRLPDTMVDMLDMAATAAMVAMEDMVATVARGRLRLPDTMVDMLDMAAMAATEVMVADITDKQIFQSS